MPRRKAQSTELVSGALFTREQCAKRIAQFDTRDLMQLLNAAHVHSSHDYKAFVEACGPLVLEMLTTCFEHGGPFRKLVPVASIEPEQMKFALLAVSAARALIEMMIDELAEAKEV
jgi:hypothetical protein